MCGNEIKQEHWHLWAFISIAMYAAIHRYEDEVFDDMSEESEKKNWAIYRKETIATCSKLRHC